MKTLLIIYRIISFILLPIAAILALIDIFALFAALANPEFLLGVFMLACIIIYTIASFIFLIKGIQNAKHCKPSLRDWIRVNAFVSLAFVVISLSSSVQYLTDAALRQKAVDQTISMQSSMPAGITKEFYTRFITGTLYFMLAYAVLLLAHIFISFILLKRYKNVFELDVTI
ncbi:MAG: hypothetical protein ACR2FN_14000 [Chitinophagaceae bacterium]